MASLAGTHWILSYNSGGAPFSHGISFGTDGYAQWGPYRSAYTEDGPAFVITVPTNDPPIQSTVFTGHHANGVGQGFLTHTPSPGWNPDGVKTPFSMKKNP